jgi:Glu-tRNA(Gln) amidotransferase subunit E-like FAD-binding protein
MGSKDFKQMAEAYGSIHSAPPRISVGEGELMLDLVSKITSTFTTFYPVYSELQEKTVESIARMWHEGKVSKELLERSLGRARTQNNKAVNNFIDYLSTGVYNEDLKNFIKDNILSKLTLVQESPNPVLTEKFTTLSYLGKKAKS